MRGHVVKVQLESVHDFSNGCAAKDMRHLSGHEGGIVREQESDSSSDLLRLTQAPHRDACKIARLAVAVGCIADPEQLRLRRPRIDRDIVWRKFGAQLRLTLSSLAFAAA